MSEARTMLAEMADGLFARIVDADFAAAWPAIEQAGFAGLLLGEDCGGFGGDWGDLFAVMRLAGSHALPLPVGELILAHRILADAGIERPGGVVSLGIAGGRVPWGRHADHVVVVSDGTASLFSKGSWNCEPGHNPADEPRDRMDFKQAPAASGPCQADALALGAFVRVAQVAGALDTILSLCVDHANTRIQFGKPLAGFQAVQQNLATLAAEAAAVSVAGQAAAAALDSGDAALELAAAKIRANQAAGTGAAIAHQVHGALGFTREYRLHHFTRRLMGWRSEFGNDAFWSRRLGQMIAPMGGRGLWLALTERSDTSG